MVRIWIIYGESMDNLWRIYGKSLWIWLVVKSTPLKNLSSSIGMMTFQLNGQIKNVPNHQPVAVYSDIEVYSGIKCGIYWYIGVMSCPEIRLKINPSRYTFAGIAERSSWRLGLAPAHLPFGQCPAHGSIVTPY